MDSRPLVNGYHDSGHLVHNDNFKPWIVQKFGGTSVGKFADQIAGNVVRWAQTLEARFNPPDVDILPRSSLRHNRIAVVCSARSGSTKLEGTTNRQSFPESYPFNGSDITLGFYEPQEKLQT